METEALKKTASTITAEDFAGKLGKLGVILKKPTLTKTAKFAGKLIGQDAKFLKFLNASVEDFEKEIPALMRDEKVMNRILAILNPKEEMSEDFLPNVRNVQAALDVLTREFVEVDNLRIAKDYSAIPDPDVQVKVAKQLEVRKRVWLRAITSSEAFKKRYGLA